MHKDEDLEVGDQELEILHSHGLVLHKSDGYDHFYEECEPGRARTGSGRTGSGLVSRCFIVDDEKRSDLEYELSREELNLEKLQKIASTGIPHGGSLRSTTWKVLLGYLPARRDLWENVLIENRSKYAKLKYELLQSPSKFSIGEEKASHEDHPLSVGSASAWNRFFECAHIAEQIDRDLLRTHPDLRFFAGNSSLSEENKEAMRNILLLFAKLNTTTRYVQGMNEVLAPIYYVFRTDSHEQNAANAEADGYACFVRLLSDSVDNFCQELDNNSSVGIHSALMKLREMLKSNDEELWLHLEFTTKVDLHYYAFRWITLLLTQEFPLTTILRIWDSLLSNPLGVQDMLLRVCCAMLICVKSKLLGGDFAANMSLLLHYPDDVDIENLLEVSRSIINPNTSTSF